MHFGALVWLFLSLFGSIVAPTATAQQLFPIQGRIAPNAATSGCIGQPTTPVCAVETLLACWVRGQPALCRAVAVSEARAADRIAGPRSSPEAEAQYSIDRASTIRHEDVTDDLKAVEWFKPGFVLVELVRRICPQTPQRCDDEPWEEMQIIVRPEAGRWSVVVWRSDNEPDTAPEIPEELRQPGVQQ